MDCKKTLNFRYFVTRFVLVAKPIERDSLPRVGAVKGDAGLLADSVVLTRVDQAVGWARKYSIFPYPFATACCAMEFMSLSMTPYDIDRFGALLPRFTPRQASAWEIFAAVERRSITGFWNTMA